MIFLLNLEAWAGVGQAGNRPSRAEARNRKRCFLFGEGGCIWCAAKVVGNCEFLEIFKEGRNQCGHSSGCQALSSELDPRGNGGC